MTRTELNVSFYYKTSKYGNLDFFKMLIVCDSSLKGK